MSWSRPHPSLFKKILIVVFGFTFLIRNSYLANIIPNTIEDLHNFNNFRPFDEVIERSDLYMQSDHAISDSESKDDEQGHDYNIYACRYVDVLIRIHKVSIET